jgi:ABC-type multidrug transport system ATPase subunit
VLSRTGRRCGEGRRRGACYCLAVADSIRIVFDDVAKRFDERVVFRSVSGEATPGEVLAVTGPNGSGKSTLLAILCGLLRPTKGSVRYLDRDGREVERRAWGQVLGAVAPAMSLYEELDAMENLRFFAHVRGLRDAEEHCRSCLDRVGLDPGRRTLVIGYSTGMRQRLKIAQAMLHRPSVLFLDEPGSNLDPAGRQWLEGWVMSEREAGTTVVLATNDPVEMEWGTRRVALAD